jgi:hypothetical protein
VIGDRSALRPTGCNCQCQGIQESTLLSSFPVPGFKGRAVRARQPSDRPKFLSHQSVAKAELRLDHHHHRNLALAWASWAIGTVAPHNCHRPQTDSQKTQKHRTRPTLELCDAVRWIYAGSPASQLQLQLQHQHPKATACRSSEPSWRHRCIRRDQQATSHQPTRTSAHSTANLTVESSLLSTLPLPYPSLKRVSEVSGVARGATMPSRSSSCCRAGMVCAGRV